MVGSVDRRVRAFAARSATWRALPIMRFAEKTNVAAVRPTSSARSLLALSSHFLQFGQRFISERMTLAQCGQAMRKWVGIAIFIFITR